MNNISLLIPALEIWGAVFTMSCFVFMIIHRRTFTETAGRLLARLELNISLLLICSFAAGLFRSRMHSVPAVIVLLLELARISLILISADCVFFHTPQDRFTRMTMHSAIAVASLSLLIHFRLAESGKLLILPQLSIPAGSAYFFRAAGLVLFLLVSMAGLLRNRKKIASGYFRALMVFFLVPLTALIFFRSFVFVDLAFSFSSLALFGIIFLDQRRILRMQEEWLLAERDRLASQKEEMSQIEIQLVLSQIQPEFLKDTLMTISGLCDTDTDAAREGVSVFADYLRGNMRSLDRLEPVFFEGHLPHIRNFLYLEKLKFGNRLESRFDFETVDFALPSLCIQPLLENAVRYGIAPLGSGTVSLRTRREEGCILVEVEDNGTGFDYDPDRDLKGAYPGIHAVRSRLVRQSGGSLEIISSPGRGTLARIRIPE